MLSETGMIAKGAGRRGPHYLAALRGPGEAGQGPQEKNIQLF